CTVEAGTARRVLHGMPVSSSEVLAWDGSPALPEGSNRAIRIKDESGRLLAIGTLPVGADIEKQGLSEQPIAVSKVLVTEESQDGRS
ncbi:MAG: hypothetical protein ACXW39_02320, partial [Nitrospira sp.]